MNLPKDKQQSQNSSKTEVFSGERLLPTTKNLLLGQMGVSSLLAIMFIINASADEGGFVKMLTGFISTELAIAIVICVALPSIVLIKHIDSLIKDSK